MRRAQNKLQSKYSAMGFCIEHITSFPAGSSTFVGINAQRDGQDFLKFRSEKKIVAVVVQK